MARRFVFDIDGLEREKLPAMNEAMQAAGVQFDHGGLEPFPHVVYCVSAADQDPSDKAIEGVAALFGVTLMTDMDIAEAESALAGSGEQDKGATQSHPTDKPAEDIAGEAADTAQDSTS